MPIKIVLSSRLSKERGKRGGGFFSLFPSLFLLPIDNKEAQTHRSYPGRSTDSMRKRERERSSTMSASPASDPPSASDSIPTMSLPVIPAIPTLFQLSIDPAVEKRKQQVDHLNEQYQASLEGIKNQQWRRVLGSDEYEELQRSELALSRARFAFREVERCAKMEQVELEAAALSRYESDQRNLLLFHDADMLNRLLSLRAGVEGGVQGEYRTCLLCRRSFCAVPNSCSTITPDGADCTHAGPLSQHCGCDVTRCKVCSMRRAYVICITIIDTLIHLYTIYPIYTIY
jgi:hypothetical protein